MNNAVFGKTVEHIRKRQNVTLVDDRKKALKFSSKPNFDRVTIFDEHLAAVHMKKTEVYFNKPIFVGQAILDISKTHMFDFHYNFIRDKYGDKAELLMTDTNSLVYHIQTDDFYKDINKDVKKWLDTSNYPEIHPSGIKTGVNKKENGVIKDEAGGLVINGFVGRNAKLYALKVIQNEEALKNIPHKNLPFKGKEEERKAKGVKKSVIKKTRSFEEYKKCLFSKEKVMRKMNIFRSKYHDVYSTTVNKVALSANDDKRIICPNKINTLALRPVLIMKNNVTNKLNMTYTEEEITCYTNILKNLNDGLDIYAPILENIPLTTPKKVSCKFCGNTHFFKDHGFRFCNKCFHSNGRVFIKDFTSRDRCHFQKKCVYKRSYHYQNKLDEIRQKYDLDIKPEVYFKLKSDLKKIDKSLNTINIQYERKRLINISYLIKRILGEYDKNEADKIELKLSDKTLKFYDDWFKTYQKIQ